MTNEAELDLIKRSIREAFADTPHPDLSTIHPLGCCEEHEQDFEWYRSHTWQEFKEFLPSGRFDPFEFFALHPVAYHYFVPGILFAAGHRLRKFMKSHLRARQRLINRCSSCGFHVVGA